MQFKYNDGGRANAVAIATGKSYVDVYTTVNLLGKQEKVLKH